MFDALKQTWNEFSSDDCITRPAALAYYTVFSLPAALLILVRVVGIFLGRSAAQGRLQAEIAGSVGPHVAEEVGTLVANAAARTGGGTVALILGLAGLLWAASNVTLQLQTTLNRAWGLQAKEEGIPSVLRVRIVSLLMISGIGLLVLIALGASAGAEALAKSWGVPGVLIQMGEVVASWIVFTLLFGAVYKVLPNAQICWADVRTGAMVTGALFVAGKFLIGLYLAKSGMRSAYGAAGSLALLLLWTFYSSTLFLLGAEFTEVWARRHGKRIEPDRHARLLAAKHPGRGEPRP